MLLSGGGVTATGGEPLLQVKFLIFQPPKVELGTFHLPKAEFLTFHFPNAKISSC